MILAYLRVSTDDQADSLARQEAKLNAYCILRELPAPLLRIDEDVSARHVPLGRRPAGARLLADLAADPSSTVLALRHDRLWRSVTDGLQTLEGWRKQGTTLHLVDQSGLSLDTSTALGWYFAVQLLAQSELEARLCGERVSSALRHKKSRGEHTGGPPPYGFRLEHGVLVRDPREEEAREIARIMRVSEGRTLKAVGEALVSRGHHPRKGGAWAPAQIAKLIE